MKDVWDWSVGVRRRSFQAEGMAGRKIQKSDKSSVKLEHRVVWGECPGGKPEL